MAMKAFKLGIKYLFRKPYTRMFPKDEPAYVTNRTRARHLLDMDACIGCRACQLACPADAIKMYKVEGDYPKNRLKIFPGIDYSRCTYCGLCVEACPTGALKMTNYTMQHLITEDKATTLYTPEMLAKPPEGKYVVTLDKKTWTPPPPPPPRKKEKKG
jgi:formate hydrogenlyase subunit 6/NADH:ubiquinone oxidoreductase subunit I